MSEFSASYHAFSENLESVVQLLKKTSNSGYVFPVTHPWTTFVVDSENFTDLHQEIIEAWSGILIHYIYTGDHGWQVHIFENSKLKFQFTNFFDDETVLPNVEQIEFLKQLLLQCGNTFEDMEEIFELDSYNFENPGAYRLAKKLKLVNYEWLSNEQDFDEVDYGVIRVN
jgi:hypothetical protein